MYQAIDPNMGTLITTEQYIQQYANAKLNDPNYQPPNMICPHCGNKKITLVARSSLVKDPYFKHPRHFGFCPSQKNKNGIYRGYKIKYPDSNNAKILKQHFYENWKYYFLKIKELVPFLRKEEFTKLIDIANEERIWEYKSVKPYHIPYLFVTLTDFPIQIPDKYNKSEKCRKFYFRYWFNSQLDNYEDIISFLNTTLLCRASYEPEKNGKISQLKGLKRIVNTKIIDDLMQKDVNNIHNNVEKWVNRYFELRNWKYYIS